MSERNNEQMNERTNEKERESAQVSKQACEWMAESMNERTTERICIDMTDNLVVCLSFVKVTHFSKFLIHSQIQWNGRALNTKPNQANQASNSNIKWWHYTVSCCLYYMLIFRLVCHRCHYNIHRIKTRSTTSDNRTNDNKNYKQCLDFTYSCTHVHHLPTLSKLWF